MNELELSNNLAQIELEINHHKQIAGQSIWEIGRRLNHVKENDLAHGQFVEWVENNLQINIREAQRMMTVARELPNTTTWSHLGSRALYLIATLPDDEKQTQLERIENGDNPTVRELQEVKRQLKVSQANNQKLYEEKEKLAEQILNVKPKVIEKEVVVEKIPADYTSTKSLNKVLLNRNSELNSKLTEFENSNKRLEETLKNLYAERDEVNQKSARYDELTQAIEESKGQLDNFQKKIFAYKEIQSLLKKGNQLLSNVGGIVYIDMKPVLNEPAIKNELETFSFMLSSFAKEVKTLLVDKEIIEGEIVCTN